MDKQQILAYAAGIVDGEGCLTISKQIRKDRPSPSYRSSVTVSNTNPVLIQFFKDNFGGVFYKHSDERTDKNNKNWATAYTWYCSCSNVVEFLESILPYLLIKKGQAEEVINFQKTKSSYPRKSLGQGKGSSPLSEREIIAKEAIYLRVKSMNSKGIYARSITERIKK